MIGEVGLRTVDEDLSSTFLDKLLFTSMINSNDAISHSAGANLASKMPLLCDQHQGAAKKGVAYQSTSSTGYSCQQPSVFQSIGRTIPMTTHSPLLASDLRKAEYLKMCSASPNLCDPFQGRGAVKSTLTLSHPHKAWARRPLISRHLGLV